MVWHLMKRWCLSFLKCWKILSCVKNKSQSDQSALSIFPPYTILLDKDIVQGHKTISHHWPLQIDLKTGNQNSTVKNTYRKICYKCPSLNKTFSLYWQNKNTTIITINLCCPFSHWLLAILVIRIGFSHLFFEPTKQLVCPANIKTVTISYRQRLS